MRRIIDQLMTEPLLRVRNLRAKLNQNLVLDNISFDVKRGDTLAVIGPNGSGKTTLFRALLGLIPYMGEIKWQKGIKIGYVPQKIFIDPDLPLTTYEFFRLKETDDREIEFALSAVGFAEDKPHIGHLKNHILNEKLGNLSGGELQRIFITWALIGNPAVLLFDEPTSGIDISAEETIYTLLYRLQKKRNITILLISHELHVVYQHATNVLCLNKEEICYGPPKETLNQESLNKLFGSNIGLYFHH